MIGAREKTGSNQRKSRKENHQSRPPANRFNRIPSWMLFATVALAPLPFGSTIPSSVALWCMVLAVSVMVASPERLRGGHFRLLALASMFATAYAFVVHEQLAEHPWLAAATPSPLWKQTQELLNIPVNPIISVAQNQPLFAIGTSLAFLLGLISAFIICSDIGRSRQLIKVIAWSGVVYATIGLASFLLDPSKILWLDKQAYLPFVTATFVNRNTAAVYFGSCGIIWSLLFMETIRKRALRNSVLDISKVYVQLFSARPRDGVVQLSMAGLCLGTMFMTGSRAGTVICLAGFIFAFVIFFSRDLVRLGRRKTILAMGASAAIALGLLQVLGAAVSGRFDAQGFSDGLRPDTYRSTLKIISDHPWFGTGLGTFPWSFPIYRAPGSSMWGTIDRGHNTILEIASELGIPFAVLVVGAWAIIFAVLVRGTVTTDNDRIIPLAALTVAGIAVLHSLIDFSIQIPGFGIVVFALVGAGLSQSCSAPETPQSASVRSTLAQTRGNLR
jgi:O-antigen ligase